MIILVTGAAGALGSTVSKELVREGHAVALLDIPSQVSSLEKLANELGPLARGYGVDLATADGLSQTMPKIQIDLGSPTGAVLIAGGWQGGAPLHERTDESIYHAMIASNLDTVYRSLRAVLPAMVAAKNGSIVVVGSRAVSRPWTSTGAAEYAATKSAVVALAQAVAAEVLTSGVRINAILPSTMDTRANRRNMPDADFSSWVSLESAARVVRFLLSDDAKDITGAAIPVYGRA